MVAATLLGSFLLVGSKSDGTEEETGKGSKAYPRVLNRATMSVELGTFGYNLRVSGASFGS